LATSQLHNDWQRRNLLHERARFRRARSWSSCRCEPLPTNQLDHIRQFKQLRPKNTKQHNVAMEQLARNNRLWQRRSCPNVKKLCLRSTKHDDSKSCQLDNRTTTWQVDLAEWEYSTNTQYVDHGKFAMLSEQGYFIALNLNSGQRRMEKRQV